MTRFWITLDQGVQFVIDNLERMHGGEIFVPKIPSMKVTDLAKAIAPECEIEIIGIRPGEKLHEAMITEDDARHTIEFDTLLCYSARIPMVVRRYTAAGKALTDGFRYTSDTNTDWLTVEELR